jgi:hypothetical protein
LQGYLAFASIRLEKLELLTLLARIHIASGSVDEAMETGENAMRSCGYECVFYSLSSQAQAVSLADLLPMLLAYRPHAAPKGPDVHILSRPELCNYEKILPAVQAFQTTELSLEEKEMITLTTLIAYRQSSLFLVNLFLFLSFNKSDVLVGSVLSRTYALLQTRRPGEQHFRFSDLAASSKPCCQKRRAQLPSGSVGCLGVS